MGEGARKWPGVGGRIASLAALTLVLAAGAPGLAGRAAAAANPADSLIYMPYGLIHSIHSSAEVDGYLAEVDSFQIGQLIFAMPTFKSNGTFKLPRHNREMLMLWSNRAGLYDAAHGASLELSAVYNGKVATKGHGLNLEDPLTRANILAGVEATLPDGVSGVQLDLEPYPTGPGFITLLEELDAAFARVGFRGRLSVSAPGSVSRWSPAYLRRVSELVGQLDPLYYDSENTTIVGYQSWMEGGLAYYSANASPSTRIVPVLPSYSANRWHSPGVENISTATEALSAGLSAGDRVNGAGIWSGWGFLLDEEGKYDGSADRGAWQSSTVGLPFST